MTRDRAKKMVSLLAVLAIAGMIFLFSAQNGEDSASLSVRLTAAILSVVMPGFRQMSPEMQQPYLERWGGVIRKLAHFSEYAALSLALVNYLRLILRRARGAAWVAWIAATAYACTDELHQMFVGGRGPAVLDVCIDSAGALTGVLAALLLLRLVHRWRRKSAEREEASRG